MKHKLLICSLAATLAVCGFTATSTLAADPAPAPAQGRFWQRVAEKLDLTPDQRAQIKTVLSGEKDTLKPLVSAMHDARKELRAAIRASDANETAVRAAAAKVGEAEANLAVERMKLYGKIAPILTETQRRKLADLQQRADAFADRAISRLGSGQSE